MAFLDGARELVDQPRVVQLHPPRGRRRQHGAKRAIEHSLPVLPHRDDQMATLTDPLNSGGFAKSRKRRGIISVQDHGVRRVEPVPSASRIGSESVRR